MHVKLKRKQDPERLSFYVVESVRIEGRPRHRTVAYLGGINVAMLDGLRSANELQILESVCAVEGFWKRVFENVRELTTSDVSSILERVEGKIPFLQKNVADTAENILSTLRAACRDYKDELNRQRATIAEVASDANREWMVRDFEEVLGAVSHLRVNLPRNI